MKIIIWLIIIVGLIGICTAAYFWYIWSSNMPYLGSIKEYRPPIITEIYSDDNEVIGRFWEEKRSVVSLEQLPQHLIQAFISAEDDRFFEHQGIDIKSIVRAFIKNITAGKIEQGGSTITQQVTRSLLLMNTERTYRRKVREIVLSIQLDKNFSKDQILFLYLNQIYLGQGAYGVEEAARTYFNKSAKDLELAESALLAGLPQAPARYSPISHFDRAKSRQKYVLERMCEEGYISEKQCIDAIESPINLRTTVEDNFAKAPYFTEHIRRYIFDKYGRDFLYRGGLKVYTSLNLSMQNAARKALKKGLHALDKREGYRGPVTHLAQNNIQEYKTDALKKFKSNPPVINSVCEGIVESVDDQKNIVTVWLGEGSGYLPLSNMEWARKPDPAVAYYSESVKTASQVLKPGDVILVRLIERFNQSANSKYNQPGSETKPAWEVSLEQTPEVQGALLCIAQETGEIKAMVGGMDFTVSQFNRSIQSRRQPGSAFKPIIYSAALDWGMSPAEILMDTPYISDNNPGDEVWKPQNYKEKFFGPTLFREALAKSRNVITVKILNRIGISYAIQYAKNMGIESPLSPDLSLALGSSGVSLMEITRAYSVFANGGMLVKPIFIKGIIDRSGQIILENQPENRKVISEETAYVMTDLLTAVIQEGTAWRIKALKRPAAGKTGTTNNLWDAWFIGYTPELVTGVWVGYDDLKAMGKGETGSRAASPIWLDFMSEVLKENPVIDFQIPDGVIFAKIDSSTGLLASPYSEKTLFQAFKKGSEPKEYSPKPTAPKSGHFSRFDMNDTK
ncbi:MAG TPA: PBP1A family penicillin-binding protein [Desulfobacteraceae bacterium]|nr:PBP1A family penicillin-binding protein [Desulfobacteraceae bacterium]HPQ28080.1 PBP1A family penicillin-binding protein [Desulfobacteraceae bacterium]